MRIFFLWLLLSLTTASAAAADECKAGEKISVAGVITEIGEYYIDIKREAANCHVDSFPLSQIPKSCKVGGRVWASGKFQEAGGEGYPGLVEVEKVACE